MKWLFLTLTVVAVSILSIQGQGRVSFQNEGTFNASDAIIVGPFTHSPSAGQVGDGIGGDKYSVQLLWLPGTGYSNYQWDNLTPSASAVFTGPAVFLTNTGPAASYSGFFDAGLVPVGPAGEYTMRVVAWYNVGFPTFAAAMASGVNTGWSALFTINVNSSPSPPNSTVFPGFSVGIIPEPAPFVLVIFGGTLTFLFHRKK